MSPEKKNHQSNFKQYHYHFEKVPHHEDNGCFKSVYELDAIIIFQSEEMCHSSLSYVPREK